MTAYRFVGSPGFSNCTCILGALPLGAASDGEIYSLPFSCEYPIKLAIPINTNAQPSRFVLIIALLSSVRESLQILHPTRPSWSPKRHWLGPAPCLWNPNELAFPSAESRRTNPARLLPPIVRH